MANVDLRSEAKQIVEALSDETLSVAVSLLTALKAQKPLIRADLLAVYPWARHLTDPERDDFFNELASAAKQAPISGDWSAVDDGIDAWRETTEILGDQETMTVSPTRNPKLRKGRSHLGMRSSNASVSTHHHIKSGAESESA